MLCIQTAGWPDSGRGTLLGEGHQGCLRNWGQGMNCWNRRGKVIAGLPSKTRRVAVSPGAGWCSHKPLTVLESNGVGEHGRNG